MKYWHFLFVEMLYQLTYIAVGLIVFSLILYYLSNRYIYHPRFSVASVAISNFLSIFSTMILFAAMFSSVLEAMFTFSIILFFITCASFYVAFKVNNGV